MASGSKLKEDPYVLNDTKSDGKVMEKVALFKSLQDVSLRLLAKLLARSLRETLKKLSSSNFFKNIYSAISIQNPPDTKNRILVS